MLAASRRPDNGRRRPSTSLRGKNSLSQQERTAEEVSAAGEGGAVIELIEGLPDGVVGLEAVGEVTSDDYSSVAIPAVEDALSRHKKISLMHVLGERFTGYTAGGEWDDAKLGAAASVLVRTHRRRHRPGSRPQAGEARGVADPGRDEAVLERTDEPRRRHG